MAENKGLSVGIPLSFAIVCLTVGWLLKSFGIGEDSLFADIFIIAGVVSAIASAIGLIFALVTAPSTIRYAIVGIAVSALILGTLWYYHDKKETEKHAGQLRDEIAQLEKDRNALKGNVEKLQGRLPSVVTVTMTAINNKIVTMFSATEKTVSITAIKTLTVQLAAVTVTETIGGNVKVEELRGEISRLHTKIAQQNSEIQAFEAAFEARKKLDAAQSTKKKAPSPTPRAKQPTAPPASSPSAKKGQTKPEGVARLKATREQGKIIIQKQQENPSIPLTEKDKRAVDIAKLSNSFNLLILRVIDGDTFVGLAQSGSRARLTIRLSAVNAPEITEIWGKEARSFLVNALGGKQKSVLVKLIGIDKYDRPVAVVFRKGSTVNESVVRQGMGRTLEFFCSEYNLVSSCDNLINAEADARENKRGIWGSPPVKGLLDNIFQSET